jgi:hypothetical protein
VAEHPWQWRDGRNPYRRTAFQVLDLGLEVQGRRSIQRQVERRRARIRNAPGHNRLFGEELNEAEVNQAEQVLRDPEARLYAELCTHQHHEVELDTKAVDALARRLDELAVPEIEASVVPDRAWLLGVLPPVGQEAFPPVAPWLEDDEEEQDEPGRGD